MMYDPNRPITLIVPTGPGASPDLMVRAMQRMDVKYLGQKLVIKNIPGGVATKGWNELAGAAPDGYTIGAVSSGMLLAPMFGPTKYHYISVLEPLAQITATPILAAVRADRPWRNVEDLIQYAGRHPGVVKFGHMGPGSPRHITGEMFAKAAGINLVQVPYDGVNALGALLDGQIQLLFTDQAEVKQHVKEGTVRVLAVAAEHRLEGTLFRQTPTFREQGINVEFGHWFGIGAPQGLPEAIKDYLAEGLRKLLHGPEFREEMENMGMSVVFLGPREFGCKWLAEQERLRNIIKEKGIDVLVTKLKA